jgi:signal peptidase
MNRKRIIHAVGVIVLLAVVIPFVIYAVPGVIGASESYVILSGSMEPEMSPGDAVIVDDRGAGSISEDDVITFSREGSETVVTHRVVDVREENGQRVFETKGDANDQPDRQPVPADAVVGEVVLTIPVIGYVVHFVNTPLGFVTTVLLPIGLFVLSEVWTFVRGSTDAGEGTHDHSGGDDSDGPGSTVGVQEANSRHAEATDGGTTSVASGREPTTGRDRKVPEGAAESGGSEIAITATDLAATTVLLVLATPYAAYVALQLQSLATIAIAYTVGFSAFAVGALQVATLLQRRERGEQRRERGEQRRERGEQRREFEGVESGADAPDPSSADGDPEAAEDQEAVRRDPASRAPDGRPRTNGDDQTAGTAEGSSAGMGAEPGENDPDGASAPGDPPDVEWGDVDLAQFEEGESR